MEDRKILMLGTDVTTKGGIASVIQDYIASGLMTRLNAEYIPTHKDGSKLFKMGFFLAQLPKIIFKMPSKDIVHIHTSHGWSFRRLCPLLFIARGFGKKAILHVHGSQFDIYYQEAGRLEKALIRRGLLAASTVIALSRDWEQKLHQIQALATVSVVKNSVDLDKFEHIQDRSLETPVRLLFLGRLGERKGVYELLDALGSLPKNSFRCILAGDGDIKEVKEIVSQRGWKNSVDVPGWVDAQNKMHLLEQSDIYLLPSHHEGLPISILEALAAGLPVISTPVGGIPEAIADGHNGYLVAPGDSQALAKAIKKLASDAQLWRQMSIQAKMTAKNQFGMPQVEAALSKIYSELG